MFTQKNYFLTKFFYIKRFSSNSSKSRFNKNTIIDKFEKNADSKTTIAKPTIFLKNKIINYFMQRGNKASCEKKVLLSLKLFQKNQQQETINHKHIVRLAILNTAPTFLIRHVKKLKRKRKNERLIPFLPTRNARLSFGLKNIIFDINNRKSPDFSGNFMDEFFLSAKKKSDAVQKKKLVQQQSIKNKKLARFRWFF